jgi:hypothetical protein
LESGQTLSEYSLVIAGIAAVCIVAVLILGGGVVKVFGSAGKPLRPGGFTPPVGGLPLTYPSGVAECQDGGWESFPQFVDEGECLDYVHDFVET